MEAESLSPLGRNFAGVAGVGLPAPVSYTNSPKVAPLYPNRQLDGQRSADMPTTIECPGKGLSSVSVSVESDQGTSTSRASTSSFFVETSTVTAA